ncbi:MAG: class I SAM-dependent methyltransferase [Anaerolineales bacterium]|nr:class I SAM-dependent methyltransferase [Anaerolineae bacterium]PWB72891.1 MAG: class I SAM-dependent methyltransferase [Anaerolineales bacterium]
MDHNDHVNLLRPANLPSGGTYADFGAGSGAFTLALRELVGLDSIIYAVDKDGSSLRTLENSHRARFNTNDKLILLSSDFSRLLDLPPLDGIIMANSLHFFRDREKVLRHVRGFLKPDGALLIVEYNVDSGNLWVPHPLSFETFRALAVRAGFSGPRLLAKVPSRFLREFYSAVCYREEK